MSFIVEVYNVRKYFPVKWRRERKYVRAVDGVSLRMKERENFGVAGESGSGKTTLARLIARLTTPTSGTIKIMGTAISNLSGQDLLTIRRNIQFIFQDSYGSLNPRQTIRQILSKPFRIYKIFDKAEVEREVERLLDTVELTPPRSFMKRYRHELSGGQLQRVCIARAISLHPKIVIADEPVSSLDVSVRAQILELLRKLQKEFSLTYLFITHDLAVLRSVCQKIAIMYLGKIVEEGTVEDIFMRPIHPYTRALLASTPVPNPHKRHWMENSVLEGDVPSALDPPTGCQFHTRCPIMEISCKAKEPDLLEFEQAHYAACPVVMKDLERL